MPSKRTKTWVLFAVAVVAGLLVGWLAMRGLPEDRTIVEAVGLEPDVFRPPPSEPEQTEAEAPGPQPEATAPPGSQPSGLQPVSPPSLALDTGPPVAAPDETESDGPEHSPFGGGRSPTLVSFQAHPDVLAAGDLLRIVVEAAGETPGELEVAVQVAAETSWGSDWLPLEFEPTSGLHELAWRVPADAPPGSWAVRFVLITDAAGNERLYRSHYDDELVGASFEVVER